jgi:opacity protein-like surface antigen
MRKALMLTVLLISSAMPAVADDTYVQGYVRKDGTYVQPHYRSAPNNSNNDNWSVQPNYNPHTGRQGTDRPTFDDRPPPSNPFSFGGSRNNSGYR